ncbi:MAG: hypothetical protein AABY93_03785 [Bacteroidota bacterium]
MPKKTDLPAGKAGKPSKKQGKARVHRDLDGLEVSINQFGELKTNMNIEKINEFLDKNVADKKFEDREKGKKKKEK